MSFMIFIFIFVSQNGDNAFDLAAHSQNCDEVLKILLNEGTSPNEVSDSISCIECIL